jgi:hypothetical protein
MRWEARMDTEAPSRRWLSTSRVPAEWPNTFLQQFICQIGDRPNTEYLTYSTIPANASHGPEQLAPEQSQNSPHMHNRILDS